MYLVRSIQRGERPKWVDQVGVKPGATLPLPFVPTRPFDRVAVIHGDRVLGFELDRVEEIDEDAVVGSRGSMTIKAKSQIHVRLGTRKAGKARVRGFQGVRYMPRWSDV